jgi:hypothetical protein
MIYTSDNIEFQLIPLNAPSPRAKKRALELLEEMAQQLRDQQRIAMNEFHCTGRCDLQKLATEKFRCDECGAYGQHLTDFGICVGMPIEANIDSLSGVVTRVVVNKE